MWISPIINRTQNDVYLAKQQIENWKQDILEGRSVVMPDLKGCINVSDLQRIENNTNELNLLYKANGYNINMVSSTTWTMTRIPVAADINRIFTAINHLSTRISNLGSSSVLDSVAGINKIENVQLIAYNHLDKIKAEGIYSDTIYAGEEFA